MFPSTEGLTALQISQLTNITRGYLSNWGVQFNHHNFTSSLPVIKACIKTGLLEIKNSDAICPEDNLSLAFKIGSKERNSLKVRAAKEFSKYNQHDDAESDILAIPASMQKQAESEYEKLIFTADPKAIKEYLKLIDQRRPVYNELLQFGREQVEILIPGSKDVLLSKQESAALVRNLMFCWVSVSQSRGLIETEEIMINKQLFINNSVQDTPLMYLAKLSNLQFNEANFAYLKDLVSQVKENLSEIPTDADDLEQVNMAFRYLHAKFLVVNPFYKLADISESDQNGNPTLWDDDKSMAVNFEGINYRVPTLKTLKLASLKRSVDDPKRSSELATAIPLVQSLSVEIQENKDAIHTKYMTEKLNNLNEKMQKFKINLPKGEVPGEIVFSSAELNAFAETQLKVIQDEKQIYDLVRKLKTRLLSTALELIAKYQSGEPAKTTEDAAVLNKLFYTPSMLMPKIRLFLRDRVIHRLRTFELEHSIINLGINSLAANSQDNTEQYYNQAKETTIIDALDLNSQFWIKKFLHAKENPVQEAVSGEAAQDNRNDYSDIFAYGTNIWNEKLLIAESIKEIADGKEYMKWSLADDSIKVNKEVASNPLSTEKNGPLKMLVNVISRLTPDELLPNDPIPLEQLVHNDILRKAIANPHSKDRDLERKILSDRLRKYLEANGFTFTDPEYKAIVKSESIRALEEDTDLWASLWKTEDEVKQWFDLLETRIKVQVKKTHKILEESPDDYAKSLNISIRNTRKTIWSTEEVSRMKISSKIRQLKDLRVVKEEK